ncbi:MAG: alpha/beta fold hydrolase [Rhizobiaceae bacterium]
MKPDETDEGSGRLIGSLHLMQQGTSGPPLILLHGFAATCESWRLVLDKLPADQMVLAYDLPGHGSSASYLTSGRTAEAADAILEDLAQRDLGTVHLCGHSMGGAIACLIALKSPSTVRSLTLLAPGGFGPEINARLLRRFAVADSEEALLPLFEQFYGWRSNVNRAALRSLVDDRKRDEAGQIYLKTAELFLDGEFQYQISREALRDMKISTRVIWGTQDRITPTRQAHKLPGEFGVHIFDGVGHSIVDEIPDQLVQLLKEQLKI